MKRKYLFHFWKKLKRDWIQFRQYDLGLILFNAAQWLEHDKKRQESRKQSEMNFMDYIQPTGYFRCKHCNGAGKWEVASPFMYFGIMGEMLIGKQSDAGGYATGELRLFDGSSPRWVSDGEIQVLLREEDEKLRHQSVHRRFCGGGIM